MKVIHSRINSMKRELSGSELLIWYLSVLQWKKLGYTTKIYVDSSNLQFIQDNGLYDLYDEVDNEYFDDETGFFATHNIDKEHFWASCKIFLLENETEPCIVSDYDFIPFANIPTDKDVVVYHREKIHSTGYYDYDICPLCYDATKYVIPTWMTFEENPINASICYINNEEVKAKYLEEAYKYTLNNMTEYHDPTVDMVYIEQRVLSELCKCLGVDITCLIDLSKETVINKNYLHAYAHKGVDVSIRENNKYPNSWHIYLFDKMNKYYPDVYGQVINMKQFTEDKEYIEQNGFGSYRVPMPLRPCNW